MTRPGVHRATDISYEPSGARTATNVQDGMDEIARPAGSLDARVTALEDAGGGGGAEVLADPGNVWQASHEYTEGDRILVWDVAVFEAKSDGSSDDSEPAWDYLANISDGFIGWRFLGELGEIPITLLPGGADDFAYVSPSVFAGSTAPADAVATHDADQTAHDDIRSDITASVADHNGLSGAHGDFRGSGDPGAGAGVPASIGDLYRRTSGSPGLYFKTGGNDTSWTRIGP